MTKPILFVKNCTREEPSGIETLLIERGLSYQVVDLDKRGDSFPKVDAYSAVIVLGGPDSANDTSKKMKEELARVKECLDQQIPILGICLGMQVLVKAAGGAVLTSPIREVGFHDHKENWFAVELTDAAKKDPLMKRLPKTLPIFHLHNETVELTNSMSLLGRGKWCENQIVKIQKHAYGIQGHFELTEWMLERWMTEDADLITRDHTIIRNDFQMIYEEYKKVATQLFNNFLDMVK